MSSNPLRNLSKFFSPILPSQQQQQQSSDLSSNAGQKPQNSAEIPRYSTSSPFPFGTPISFSRNSVLNPKSEKEQQQQLEKDEQQQQNLSLVSRSRARGRDLYGGRVMFGGSNSTSNGVNNIGQNIRRHNRLLASTPYQSSMKHRSKKTATNANMNLNEANNQLNNKNGQSSSGTPSPSSSLTTTPENVGMSSTARIILETLEKMSTPLRDAQKIPVPRAEKRHALATELLERGSIFSDKRKRPKLGSGSGFLSGPPLRTTLFSPTNVSHLNRSRHQNRNRTADQHQAETTLNVMSTTKDVKGRDNENYNTNNATTSGKVRAKVSEKAKARAERNLEEESHNDELPSYLQQPKALTNPFTQMNSLPSFQFGKPPTKSSVAPSTKKDFTFTSTKKDEKTEETAIKFSTNSEVLKKVLQTTAVLTSSTKPEFIFSQPQTVKNFPLTRNNYRQPPSDHVFMFSDLQSLRTPNSISNQTPFAPSDSSKQLSFEYSKPKLPDLTEVGTNFRMTKNNSSNSFSPGSFANTKLKVGSVMDILGGNHKLPDVTAGSDGLIPAAKTLKQGSVMDFFGKSGGTDNWKNTSPVGNKPWAL